MDEDQTVARDNEQLEDLDQRIKQARQRLDDMTDIEAPEFYEDDETPREQHTPGAETPHDPPPGTEPGALPG